MNFSKLPFCWFVKLDNIITPWDSEIDKLMVLYLSGVKVTHDQNYQISPDFLDTYS
jgi:hypothetical protein